ncbi:hypothetical protein PR048_030373 [Dryococelus australis]|uniref:Uncharacterized protein n=1 Tax=Dryococelus australis TaxID=614101 RepID=A0ABQ9G9K6_9NEOP|nr:hypothetical protein PR048_030373 [Dryococelus australis]
MVRFLESVLKNAADEGLDNSDKFHYLVRGPEKAKIQLSYLYDQVQTKLRALETLGITSDKYTVMSFPLVESCLNCYNLGNIAGRCSKVRTG